MYLAKNFVKNVCSGKLKFQSFCSNVFPSIFGELWVGKAKFKSTGTHCGNTLPGIP